MAFRVTVRRGPAVKRSTAPDLPAALDLVEAAARDTARTERPATVELRFRAFTPADQVVARIEVAGPQRLAPSVRAGVDVRGDGSMTAHVGRARREAVEEETDETALQALRRVLGRMSYPSSVSVSARSATRSPRGRGSARRR